MYISGWFIAALSAFVAAAAVAQGASDLPASYTWLEPVRILLRSVIAPDFMTGVAFAALCTGYHRKIWRQLSSALRSAPGTMKPVLRLVGGGSLGIGLALFVVPSFTLLDKAVLVVFLAAGFAQPPTRETVKDMAVRAASLLGLLLFVSYGFTVFKALLFTSVPAGDAFIMSLERHLFGAPLHQFFARLGRDHPAIVLASDAVYFRFFQHMALVAVFLFMLGRRREQMEFALALGVAYMIGAFAYYALPSLGPAFADASAYAHLWERSLLATDVEAGLLANTQAAISGSLPRLESYSFLASMPSLHVTHELIMLYYCRRSMPFFIFGLLFLVATAVATMVLGWHYFADFVPAFPLALVSIVLARRSLAAAVPSWRARMVPAIAD